MDFAAGDLGTKIAGFLPRKPQFVLAAVTTASVLLILLVAQVFLI